MNIAFIHQDFPGGGTEKVTINVAKLLEQEDSKVYVFASRIHSELFLTGENVSYLPIS